VKEPRGFSPGADPSPILPYEERESRFPIPTAMVGALTGGTNYYRAARLVDYFTEADRQAFLDDWTRPGWNIGGERFFEGLSPADVFGEAGPPPPDDLHDDASGGETRVPALLLTGEKESFALTERFDWFPRRVPNGKLVSLPNAGHRLVHEQGTLVTGHIRAFVERGC
jgi:pimeloyl-ACP methyl ester carboxylesterase